MVLVRNETHAHVRCQWLCQCTQRSAYTMAYTSLDALDQLKLDRTLIATQPKSNHECFLVEIAVIIAHNESPCDMYAYQLTLHA